MEMGTIRFLQSEDRKDYIVSLWKLGCMEMYHTL
jgi:hypothetical protein